MTTPKSGDFDLHLPAGTKDMFQASIAEIPTDMRVWWRYHKVGDGDTLASVAKQYRTTVKAIGEVNNLAADDPLPRDTKLIIPVNPGELREGTGVTYSKATVRYKVRQGDTVLSVADEWAVAPEMVRKWNRLKGNDLRRGRILLIHRPVTDTARVSGGGERSAKSSKSSKSKSGNSLQASSKTSAKRVTHTVKKGETLSSIASRYNTSVAALRRDNSRAASHLKPGDVLIISSVR
jgi:membrane-bound lytic murein transglycosylase D